MESLYKAYLPTNLWGKVNFALQNSHIILISPWHTGVYALSYSKTNSQIWIDKKSYLLKGLPGSSEGNLIIWCLRLIPQFIAFYL